MIRRQLSEPPKVHMELVAALFTASVPLSMMIATFVLVGLYVTIGSKDVVAAIATASGIAAAAFKVGLHLHFRSVGRVHQMDVSAAHGWENRFAISNILFAAALGALTARSFALVDPGAQLLTTGMLFGFCSGQVARIAVRPHICAWSIIVAAVPAAIAAAAHGGISHLGLAAMFTLFTVGGLESARYAYGQIRQRIVANFELENIAGVDPLTGLFNRLGLRRAVEGQASSRDTAAGAFIAVHCFDLDGFKGVNDKFGHSVGDALLVELASRVSGVLRDGDIAARLGGDEFLVTQWGVRHPDEAEMFARRLCRAVTTSYDIGGQPLTIGMSLGSCTGRPNHDLLEDMIGVADARMYDAKRSGGGIVGATRVGYDR